MENIQIFGNSIYFWFYNFILYSILGWLYEGSYALVIKHRLVNRGFLNGPIIPIYGFGATILCMLVEPFRSNLILIFVIGVVAATALEYFTSLIMEKIFHTRWWDYTNLKFNFQGRVCLYASLFWGILAIVIIEFQPIMLRIIHAIPMGIGRVGVVIITVVGTADLIITIIGTIEFDQNMTKMQTIRNEIEMLLEKSKFYETKNNIKENAGNYMDGILKNQLEKYKLSILIGNLKEQISGKMDKFGEHFENRKEVKEEREKDREKESFYSELEENISEYLKKYALLLDPMKRVPKRLINAFPTMRSDKKQIEIEQLKERLKAKKDK